jgi:hypothetical protein
MLPDSVESASGTVYHYTSKHGLLGMGSENEIWASEANSLNDLSEILHGWGLIEAWLESQPDSLVIRELRELAIAEERPREVFLFSASLESDDANQWRLYADDGHGYAVGFDTSISLAVLGGPKPEAEPPTTQTSSTFGAMVREIAEITPWLRVTYDDSKVAEHMTNLADMFAAELAIINNQDYGANEDAASDDYYALRGATFSAMATVAALAKSKGFRGESEARVVITLRYGQVHYRFRSGAAGIVPYVPLVRRPAEEWRHVTRDTDEIGTLPISSIRLGPHIRPENKNAVRLLLRSKGFDHSKITFGTSDVPLA